MDPKDHWEKIHTTNPGKTVSWYRPHLELSLSLIEKATPNRSASIIDVGAGQSSLVGDLFAQGYRNLTALDVSGTAIARVKEYLGPVAENIQWVEADVRDAALEQNSYDVWHDRAVFHFLIEKRDRDAYVRKMLSCLKPGGYAVISTFAIDGPSQCSGLNVARYDAKLLDEALGLESKRVESFYDLHRTPSGTSQNFLYAVYRV
jgi:2-polyprenyl-3-methyl-5-hydroxy-6-metoxy-1,4-benzoquinol methylase